MTILTASSISRRELATIFNQAFSDYMIEVYFTDHSLEEYIRRHGLDLETSLVAEADGLMVGLLLCGTDGTTTWNAVMGIHPRWRRKGLGSDLLDAWLESSRKAGVHRALLEVIKQNLVATNIYRSRDFMEVRAYQGFEGRAGEPGSRALPPDASSVDVSRGTLTESIIRSTLGGPPARTGVKHFPGVPHPQYL